MNATDQLEAFKTAIAASGLTPPDTIELDQIQRFSDDGRRNNLDGWCFLCLNSDGSAGGSFGNWKDVNETWFSGKDGQSIDRAQQRRIWHEIEKAREKIQAEKKATQDRAAVKAQRIWSSAKSARADHPYLVRKKISPNVVNIRQQGKVLIIPLLNEKREIRSIEFIYPDGVKRFLKDGQKKGCFSYFGKPKESSKVYISEGYGTGATTYEATETPVIIAFDAGNLKPVCHVIKKLHPGLELIIAADNDLHRPGNPGKTKAEDAAKEFNLSVTIPDRKGDFNDLVCEYGLSLSDVKNQLESNLYRPDETKETVRDLYPKKPFPWAILPCDMAQSLQQLARSCASSSTPLPGAAIAIFSSLIGSTIDVSPKNSWKEPLIFWFCDIRPSGSGKTPAARELCTVLYETQKWVDQNYEREKSIWEDLPKKDRGEPPARPRGYFVTDLTLEGLRNDHSGHGGKVCILDELSSFVSGQNQYKSGKGSDRESWLCLHDGKPARIVRARESITLFGSRVSIFGGVQPGIWRMCFGSEDGEVFLQDGTIYRFLPTFEGDSFRPLTNESWSDKNREAWEGLLKRAMAWADNLEGHRELCLSEDAQRAFFDWRNELFQLKEDLPKPVRGFVPKLVGYALRFAGVLYLMHRFNGRQDIGAVLGVEDIQRGVELSEFYLGHIVEAMDALTKDVEPGAEITEQALHLARVLKEIEPEADSGRLSVGYIQEQFDKTCQNGIAVKTPHRMGTLLRKHGLSILRGHFQGKGGMRCLVLDEKTKSFIEQCHQSHHNHQSMENQIVIQGDIEKSKSPEVTEGDYNRVTMVTSENQSHPTQHVDIKEDGDYGDNDDFVSKHNGNFQFFDEGEI